MTATFSAAIAAVDVRIIEYGGISTVTPIDVTVGATGTATTNDSGPAITTHAHDLIFGANATSVGTVAAGAAFTQRLLVAGDIAEDREVATAGTYQATATQSATGVWVMRLVAFEVAP